MARKSQAAAVAQVFVIRPTANRLPVPQDMAPEPAEVWRTTTAALPPDWFTPEHGPLLALYCRHIARAGQIERVISGLDPLADLAAFDRLVKLAALESAKAAMHARAMRLTHQSRLKAETAASRAGRAGPRGIEALRGLDHD